MFCFFYVGTKKNKTVFLCAEISVLFFGDPAYQFFMQMCFCFFCSILGFSNLFLMRFFYILLTFVFCFLLGQLSAQDTIKVMQYNLLNYGYYTSYCTYQNNSADSKDQYLRTLINHYEPEIFAVNELGSLPVNLTRILDNVMNSHGRDYYQAAAHTNQAGSSIINALYYDSRKLGLKWQGVANTTLRDINVYTLYYKSDDLATNPDTVFITCVVAHLKAGSTASDQQTRKTMVLNTMNYLKYYNFGNMMFMGDFNLQSSYEESYQLMINNTTASVRFNDPIEQHGVWNNNASMAPYHTQSTRTGVHDCFSTGGMDDRFDFILISNSIKNGSMGAEYVPGSYWAVGQDGNRYNQSINNPVNTTLPSSVINALFNMSDHLPIILDLKIERNPVFVEDDYATRLHDIKVQNPFTSDIDVFFNKEIFFKNLSAEIFSLNGRLEKQWMFEDFSGVNFRLQVDDLPSGLYLLRLGANGEKIWSGKLIKP